MPPKRLIVEKVLRCTREIYGVLFCMLVFFYIFQVRLVRFHHVAPALMELS